VAKLPGQHECGPEASQCSRPRKIWPHRIITQIGKNFVTLFW